MTKDLRHLAENLPPVAGEKVNGVVDQAQDTVARVFSTMTGKEVKAKPDRDFLGSVTVAWKESFSKSEGFLDYLKGVPQFFKVFLENYFGENKKIEERRDEVKDEATNDLTREVLDDDPKKLAGNLKKQADEAGLLSTDSAEQEADAGIFMGILADSMKLLDNPGKALSAAGEIKKAAESGKAPEKALQREQVAALGGVSLFTIANLRAKFSNKEQLAAYFTKLQTIGESSAKLKDLLNYTRLNLKGIFDISPTEIPGLLGIPATKFIGLANPLLTDKFGEGMEIVLNEIFPKSVKKNGADNMRNLLTRIFKANRPPTVQLAAEMISMFEEEELRDLAKKLSSQSGKRELKERIVKQTA